MVKIDLQESIQFSLDNFDHIERLYDILACAVIANNSTLLGPNETKLVAGCLSTLLMLLKDIKDKQNSHVNN